VAGAYCFAVMNTPTLNNGGGILASNWNTVSWDTNGSSNLTGVPTGWGYLLGNTPANNSYGNSTVQQVPLTIHTEQMQ